MEGFNFVNSETEFCGVFPLQHVSTTASGHRGTSRQTGNCIIYTYKRVLQALGVSEISNQLFICSD